MNHFYEPKPIPHVLYSLPQLMKVTVQPVGTKSLALKITHHLMNDPSITIPFICRSPISHSHPIDADPSPPFLSFVESNSNPMCRPTSLFFESLPYTNSQSKKAIHMDNSLLVFKNFPNH